MTIRRVVRSRAVRHHCNARTPLGRLGANLPIPAKELGAGNQRLASAAGPKQCTTPLSSAIYNRPEAIAGDAKNAPRIS